MRDPGMHKYLDGERGVKFEIGIRMKFVMAAQFFLRRIVKHENKEPYDTN